MPKLTAEMIAAGVAHLAEVFPDHREEFLAELATAVFHSMTDAQGEDTATDWDKMIEDMPDIMRERHPDGSGGVKTLATHTAKTRTCQGTYDEVMAARQRAYEERLSGGCA